MAEEESEFKKTFRNFINICFIIILIVYASQVYW